jgi:hypothetical protein
LVELREMHTKTEMLETSDENPGIASHIALLAQGRQEGAPRPHITIALQRGASFRLRLATQFPSTSGTAKHLEIGAGGHRHYGENCP